MPDAPVTSAPAPADAPTPTPTPADVAGRSTPDAPPQPDPDTPGADALGDPGKKALDAMKAKWKAAEDKARLADERAAAAEAKAAGKEAEFTAEQERRKVESAANEKANQRILKAEIRAAAANKLADPTDALRYLDLEQFEVGDDGEVDAAAITAAIEDLVTSKPYLAAQGGTPEVVFESPGAHRAGTPVGQLTEADLKNMTPTQIDTARAEGRLNTLLGITA